MKIYNELESLGFFEWLSETHNLKDTDMNPEYLDKLPLDDIHRTVCNSMALRWFREKYGYHSYIDSLILSTTNEFVYDYVIVREGIEPGDDGITWKTPEEAEFNCLVDLIELVKNK
jgi:hypothetical protein